MGELADKLAGRFLVVDGPDGAGKTTQVALLAEWLAEQGVAVTRVRDPGGTAIGDRIRSILLDNEHGGMSVECETMLYMASRAQLVAEVVRPAMAHGECILSDRYIAATVAYQGAGGMDPAAVQTVAEIAVGGCRPELTIVLDLPAEQGLKRLTGDPDRMESKDLHFHQRVREMFLQQARDLPRRFAVVNATGTVEEVQQRIRETILGWTFG
ncbi:MAG TPA: dTMP kinase [Phycisphaerae bacterium]|nr:dTMP kinase [Phycisphaerae bacterium]